MLTPVDAPQICIISYLKGETKLLLTFFCCGILPMQKEISICSLEIPLIHPAS